MAKSKNNRAHKALGVPRLQNPNAPIALPKVVVTKSQARVAGAAPGFGRSLPGSGVHTIDTSPYNTILLWLPPGPAQDVLLRACHSLKAQARLIQCVGDVFVLPSLAVFVDPVSLTVQNSTLLREVMEKMGPEAINLVFVGALSAHQAAIPFAHHWQEREVTIDAVQGFLQGLRQLPACMTTRIAGNPHGESLEETLQNLVLQMPDSFGVHFLLSSLSYVNFMAYRAAFDYYEALGARYPQVSVDRRLSRYLHGLPLLLQPEGVAVPPLVPPGYTPLQNWRRVKAGRSSRSAADSSSDGLG